jgi:hypothetical protein
MVLHRSFRHVFGILLAAGLIVSGQQSAGAVAPPPAAEAAARRAILARIDALQAIELDYSVERTHTPPGLMVNPFEVKVHNNGINGTVGTMTIDQGVYRFEQRFAFLKGMSRWESRPEKPRPATIQTFRPTMAEQFTTFPDGRKSGRIFAAGKLALPLTEWVGLALGLRDADSSGGGPWMTPDTINAMMYALDKDGRVVLSRITPRGERQEFVFDPAHQSAFVSYRLLAKDTDTIIFEATAADFRAVNGVEVPYAMTARIVNLKLKAQILLWEAHVTQCELNGTTNTEERYRIAWPQGIDIVDTRPDRPVRIKVQHDGEKTPD